MTHFRVSVKGSVPFGLAQRYFCRCLCFAYFWTFEEETSHTTITLELPTLKYLNKVLEYNLKHSGSTYLEDQVTLYNHQRDPWLSTHPLKKLIWRATRGISCRRAPRPPHRSGSLFVIERTKRQEELARDVIHQGPSQVVCQNLNFVVEDLACDDLKTAKAVKRPQIV